MPIDLVFLWVWFNPQIVGSYVWGNIMKLKMKTFHTAVYDGNHLHLFLIKSIIMLRNMTGFLRRFRNADEIKY